jgi:hypothetical protein
VPSYMKGRLTQDKVPASPYALLLLSSTTTSGHTAHDVHTACAPLPVVQALHTWRAEQQRSSIRNLTLESRRRVRHTGRARQAQRPTLMHLALSYLPVCLSGHQQRRTEGRHLGVALGN